MKHLTALIVFLIATTVFSATSAEAREWMGMLAVQESPLVNQVMRESNYDPEVAYPVLRALLDAGEIDPARGRYCMQPFRNGRRDTNAECKYIRTGIWTRWAPDYMVAPNRAMCIRVPSDWPAIAGQLAYPTNGGFRYNCFDFKDGDTFPTREDAAMILVIEPLN